MTEQALVPRGRFMAEGRHRRCGEVLGAAVARVLAKLEWRFRELRQVLLEGHVPCQEDFERGLLAELLRASADVPEASWRPGAPPTGLVQWKGEVTGRTKPKMAMGAMGFGAKER